ncbi:MAG: extracellular solute-binding protein [Chloroflexota bacterium]|nr:extracellular solute-binding protein [Chloroflexota bacterium]
MAGAGALSGRQASLPTSLPIRTRRSVMAGAATGMMGLLASCAGPAATGGEAPAAQSKAPVTIRWSTWGDANNPFNSAGIPRGMPIFNLQFPHIKVLPEIQEGASTIWGPKLSTSWLGGDGVDITGHCCDVSLDFSRQGFLLNLDPYLKRDAKAVPTQDYVEWLMKLFNSPQNGQFALPMYTGTIALMFDRKRFQEKGLPLPDENWDWNKYREVALKLADPAAKKWARADVGPSSMYRRFFQNGTSAVDPKDDTKATFNTPQAIEAMEFEKAGMHKDRSVVQVAGPLAPPETAPASQTQFVQINSGHISMWEGGAFTLTRYVSMLTDDIDWDVVSLPKGPTARVTLATNDGWSIWKDSKAKDATWELLKFLQSDEWTDIATRTAGQQSARKSHQQQWVKAFAETNPKLAGKALKWCADAIEKNYARPIEFWRKDADSKKIFNDAYNKSVRDGEEEVGAAMRAAAEQINQVNKV